MYKQRNNSYSRNSGFRKNNFNRSNRFQQNKSRRIVRFFDPTHLVKTSQTEIFDSKPYISTNSFESFKINDLLKKNVLSKGYVSPTPIQDQTIPYILDGKDVIGVANTGTGKTAAFLIPIIETVYKNKNQKVLIVAPTRELALQIKNEFMDFAKGLGIYCAFIIGGANMHRQKQDLYRNPNFVIGTPGRIKDLIQQRVLDLSSFGIVVLDEVDQMVDIGFVNDIKFFISLLNKERQSLFFSAIVESKVRGILSSFVKNPITVSVKKQDTLGNIKQDVVRIIDKYKKIEQLHDLLNQKDVDKVLIFGRTKWGVQKLSDELAKRGFQSEAIHGDKRQAQRQRALDKFKSNQIKILLATDVASRGLDIDNVSHVINYDPPESYQTYIHRIGRTGRLDKPGTAITFI
ncbi:MAG: DEAD/DEAH box helicase [bacterium]